MFKKKPQKNAVFKSNKIFYFNEKLDFATKEVSS